MSAKLISLWEIMNLFEAGRFQEIIDDLRSFASDAYIFWRECGDRSDSKFTKNARDAVERAALLARLHDFKDAERIALRAKVELGHESENMTIRSEVNHVADALCDEIKKHTFLRVAQARGVYVENPSYMGQTVLDSFPSALNDINEAGNCLAADCNTAAVFHLMRVVEWGLRAFCVHLGLHKAKNKKGKKNIPIAYAEWETMLNQLQPKAEEKIDKMRRGPSKQAAQEFYLPVLQEIRAIRGAWRIHLMHTRATYSAGDADAISGHVKRLMSTLATKVREQ